MQENTFIFRMIDYIQLGKEAYIRSVPEFTSEKSLHTFYLDYYGREQQMEVYEFWRHQVLNAMEQVFCSPMIEFRELHDFFILHKRYPLALDRVVREMRQDGLIQFLHELEEGTSKIYQSSSEPKPQPGLMSRLFGKLTSWFSQEETKKDFTIDHDEVLVNMQLIQKISQRLVEQLRLIGQEMKIFTEQALRYTVLKVMDRLNGQKERDLVINHLLHSKELVRSCVEVDGRETQVYKIPRFSSDNEIGELEKALLLIDVNTERLHTKINSIEENMHSLREKAKEAVKEKRMEFAKFLLQKRKKTEKFLDHLSIMAFQLEEQKMGLLSAEANASVLETMKLANKANKQTAVKVEEFEKVVEELEASKQDQEEFQSYVAEKAESEFSDAEILKELEQSAEKENSFKLPNAPSEPVILKGEAAVGGGEQKRVAILN